MRAITGWLLSVGASAAILITCGCSGSEFGTAVEVPPSQRYKLPKVIRPGIIVKLPADEQFNVHDKQWNSTPGANGQANPSADATGKGTAFCKADASNGGASWAEFELGYCLDYPGDKPVRVELRMTIDYHQHCEATPGAVKTVSNYAAKIFVKNSAGRVVQTLPLATHSTEEGRVNWTGTERTITDVTFQPGMGYYIILAGRAEAGSDAKTSSSADITIKSFVLELLYESPTTATSATKAK
jgi:hypothetical protein